MRASASATPVRGTRYFPGEPRATHALTPLSAGSAAERPNAESLEGVENA